MGENRKPNYFKFFDGYMDTIETCGTLKDKGLLITAMIDFWKTGKEPQLPEKLRDKWRFIGHSLSGSRKKSYEKLGENPQETDGKVEEFSSDYQQKSSGIPIENQSVSQNHCTVVGQSVTGIENKNKESNTIVDSNDSTIGLDLDNNKQDYLLYEVYGNTEMPDSYPVDDSYYPEGQNTNYWELNEARDNLLSQPSQPSAYQGSFSMEAINEAASKVLQRIQVLYKAQNKPVCYTKTKAMSELGMSKDLLYKATDYLKQQGLLDIQKVTLKDGKVINSYTPLNPANISNTFSHNPSTITSTANQYVFRSIKRGSEGFDDLEWVTYRYFQQNPFYFDASWSPEEFYNSNAQILAQAREEVNVSERGIQRMSNFMYDSLRNIVDNGQGELIRC